MEKLKMHLTDNYLLRAADECISKLKVELGQANAYIEELESNEVVSHLIKENEELKQEIKRLNHCLSSESIDERITKRNKTIHELNGRIKALENSLNILIRNDKKNS